jgi:excisionase family DNA binding protein
MAAKLMTMDDIADFLQLSKRTAQRLVKKDHFPPSIRLGRIRRWPADLIREWLRRNTRDYFHGDYCTLENRYGAAAVPIVKATHRVSTSAGHSLVSAFHLVAWPRLSGVRRCFTTFLTKSP